ncbi:hypothetical protein [Qipengyuania oceanensis]|uniref:Large polyvalent protein associated domain-containing protein n=1 Tax=Qipengyuania oceanensis TaxID=1463597 RepID=A0A844YFX8_9SPHN|nr:hypothetical protein [Qipengyuania oceanensis]MXO63420.1 hypothetical protein [Qipengyuania oceanensis]
MDAPEKDQVGYRRSGQPVRIGENSTRYLQGEILNTGANLAQIVGKSYGRTVGPVTLGDRDAGLSSIRAGQSLAAPDYLKDAPQRRFDYMEAERLARMNRLGQHQTLTLPPDQFRKQPDWQPDRQTVAQFFDTPTPFQGMRPEAEAEYVGLLRSGTAQQIYDFGTSQGFGMDREQVEEWTTARDKAAAKGQSFPVYPNYQQGPRILTDAEDGSTGAGVRGFASGFLAGGLDEAGAVADALGGTSGRENVWNSDRRLADILATNLYQNQSILGYDDSAHPTASTVGQLGGAITSGFALPWGAGARTVPQLAKVGAAYGAAEGGLGTDGDWIDRTKGAMVGAPVGAAINAAGGKALEYAVPAAARAYRAFTGKDGRSAARATAEVAEGYADETAFDAASTLPERVSGRSMAMDAPGASVSSSARRRDYLDMGAMRPRPMMDPATAVERQAAAARIGPADVLPMPSTFVDGVDEAAAMDAGRFVEAKAPNERGALETRTITNWVGQPVPKVGPVDMVGWLRLQGGLKNQGGELDHMGLTNAARRGIEHVGQEARFGPLVNEGGASLDDAAHAAWEAGYFPDHAERPSVSEFLDALRETYEGGPGRRFHPDDMAELDQFEGMRADRYALEQQQFEEGGQIWQDRSVPADDAPYPPVQAYEDWGPTAPDFAGNIRLDKLDSPQDISRALVQSERRTGFDAATRGRVAQAETERLASELNMTPDQLLSRRKGQAFNAEEALAARQLLAKSGNELVNAAKRIKALDDPGDELLAEFRQKWLRHVAIQEQVAGATAEAGRALQQFRMGADARAIRGEVLNSLVRGGGGKDDLQDAAGALLDAVELEPGKFNALAEKLTKPKWQNKISELYINFLLSNPPTHVVNMVSNSLTSIAQIPEYATASVVGAGRKALFRDKAAERIAASEVGARTFGLIQGAKEGFRLFGKALRTGEADDFASKVEGEQYKAIEGFKGEVIRVPTRLLTAEDQLFKGIARRMELNGEAMRIANREGLKGEARQRRVAELVANPTDEMFEKALEYGRYLTFQRKLGPFGQAISNATSNNLMAKVVVPFVRTPINLMKFATERSLAAPLLKEWRQDFNAGGERRDLAVAKAMLGTGFATLIYQAALDGTITGAVPPDPKKARLMYADGWQPYSIKAGDRYVSYSRLDPFSTTIGVAADMATLPKGLSDRQRDDMAVMLVASIMGNLASKTWLSGASSFTEALSDPGRYADNWVERTVSSFAVPAGVAGVARAIDPVSRKRESIGEAVQARIPGMTDELMPRRDVFGEAIENDSLGPDFISPFWQSKGKDDPVVAEMLRIEASVSAPGKSFTEDGERIDYTPEQYDRYHEIAGRLTYISLLGLVGSEDYLQADEKGKRKAAKKAVAAARKTAREYIDDPDYQLPAKGAAAGPEAAWPGKRATPSAPKQDWPGKPVADRDVMGGLSAAIPGIQYTSGFRDYEYNQSLKRRGYQASDNSTHMNGDTLDMLPPPGRSLGWLRAQVAKQEPDARLLVHDGHLHAQFPDWNGAPRLGGAAKPQRLFGAQR